MDEDIKEFTDFYEESAEKQYINVQPIYKILTDYCDANNLLPIDLLSILNILLVNLAVMCEKKDEGFEKLLNLLRQQYFEVKKMRANDQGK